MKAQRLDQFLAGQFPDVSRMFFKRLIKSHSVLVDKNPVSPHHKLKIGQKVTVQWPRKKKSGIFEASAPIPYPILIEDDILLVINKPAGAMVHPTSSHFKGKTMIDWIRPHLNSENWPDEVRPGLVHRLDRDTSGVIIFAKTPQAHAALSKQFAQREVSKTYFALVKGVMPAKKGTLEGKLGRDPFHRKRFTVSSEGRDAITHFKVMKEFGKEASHLEIKPVTGRTHQIRVQLAWIHHPILGDKVYGGAQPDFDFVPRHMLHAGKLKFRHPETGKIMEIEAPVPEDFKKVLKIIRS